MVDQYQLFDGENTLITFENWKRCVANNPSVIEFLYKHRRDNTIAGL